MVERNLAETDKLLPVLPEGSRELFLVRQFISRGSAARDLVEVFHATYPKEDIFHIDGYLAAIRTIYSPDARIPERNPFVVATRVAYLAGQLPIPVGEETRFPKVNRKEPNEVMSKLVELFNNPIFRKSWRAIAGGYSDRRIASIINGNWGEEGHVAEREIVKLRDHIYSELGVNRYGFAVLGLWLEG